MLGTYAFDKEITELHVLSERSARKVIRALKQFSVKPGAIVVLGKNKDGSITVCADEPPLGDQVTRLVAYGAAFVALTTNDDVSGNAPCRHSAYAKIMRSGRSVIGVISVAGAGERNRSIAEKCHNIFFGIPPRRKIAHHLTEEA
jgi:hypothetical protein